MPHFFLIQILNCLLPGILVHLLLTCREVFLNPGHSPFLPVDLGQLLVSSLIIYKLMMAYSVSCILGVSASESSQGCKLAPSLSLSFSLYTKPGLYTVQTIVGR
jgi:hypothetical protein